MSALAREPKISALLNNCGLHCAVPSVMKRLHELAPKSIFSKHFEKLLNTFQVYYGLEQTPSSQQLYHFLAQYHPLEQQLILGGVLRQLAFGSKERDYNTLTETGYYPLLENEKLEQDVLNPLGITANVYSLNMSKGQLIAHQATMSKQDRSLITINIYLKNGQGHYELSENPERDTPSECKFYEKFETLFQEAYAKDPRKSNDSPVPRVEAVLKRLKVEVRSAFNSMTHSRSLFFTPRTKRGALIGAQIGTLSGIALGIYLSLSDTITFAMIGLNSLPPYAAIILLTVIMTAIVSALFAITYKLNEPEDNAQCRC